MMQRASTFALCCLLLAGCTSARGSKKPAGAGAGQTNQDTPAADSTAVVPGPVQVVGRVIAVDMRTLAVIIDLGPFVVLPSDFATRQLISRRDDLQPTARLQSSPYLRGRTLGARLLAGQAQVGDEVVFLPETP